MASSRRLSVSARPSPKPAAKPTAKASPARRIATALTRLPEALFRDRLRELCRKQGEADPGRYIEVRAPFLRDRRSPCKGLELSFGGSSADWLAAFTRPGPGQEDEEPLTFRDRLLRGIEDLCDRLEPRDRERRDPASEAAIEELLQITDLIEAQEAPVEPWLLANPTLIERLRQACSRSRDLIAARSPTGGSLGSDEWSGGARSPDKGASDAASLRVYLRPARRRDEDFHWQISGESRGRSPDAPVLCLRTARKPGTDLIRGAAPEAQRQRLASMHHAYHQAACIVQAVNERYQGRQRLLECVRREQSSFLRAVAEGRSDPLGCADLLRARPQREVARSLKLSPTLVSALVRSIELRTPMGCVPFAELFPVHWPKARGPSRGTAVAAGAASLTSGNRTGARGRTRWNVAKALCDKLDRLERSSMSSQTGENRPSDDQLAAELSTELRFAVGRRSVCDLRKALAEWRRLKDQPSGQDFPTLFRLFGKPSRARKRQSRTR